MPERTPLAFDDKDFLRSGTCRGMRLALEFMKPEDVLRRHHVTSTVVIFGSARLRPEKESKELLSRAQKALAADPENSELRQEVMRCEQLVKSSHYYDMAREFASVVTEFDQSTFGGTQMVVMTGGGPGIMEAGNRGATEKGGMSIGLTIKLPYEETANKYITPGMEFPFHYFAMRKMHFMKRASALACFPGGFGTMDELFEALTLVQTGITPRIPILLFGSAFWKTVVNWNAFAEMGMISPEDLHLFHFCDSAQDGLNAIRLFYAKRLNVREDSPDVTQIDIS